MSEDPCSTPARAAMRNGTYRRRVPVLMAPTVRLETAWREAHLDWGPGTHEDGFGLHADDDVHSGEGFSAWIARLDSQEDRSIPRPVGEVHCTYRWIVEDGQVLGGISLRHELTEFNAHLGHIGYGVRPSARRRGLATWALGQMLVEAQRLGLARVLLVCQADNVASAKTIRHHGGILESEVAAGPVALHRYWIKLTETP